MLESKGAAYIRLYQRLTAISFRTCCRELRSLSRVVLRDKIIETMPCSYPLVAVDINGSRAIAVSFADGSCAADCRTCTNGSGTGGSRKGIVSLTSCVCNCGPCTAASNPDKRFSGRSSFGDSNSDGSYSGGHTSQERRHRIAGGASWWRKSSSGSRVGSTDVRGTTPVTKSRTTVPCGSYRGLESKKVVLDSGYMFAG